MAAPIIPNTGPQTVTTLTGNELVYLEFGSQDFRRIKVSDFAAYVSGFQPGATGATGMTGPTGSTGPAYIVKAARFDGTGAGPNGTGGDNGTLIDLVSNGAVAASAATASWAGWMKLVTVPKNGTSGLFSGGAFFTIGGGNQYYLSATTFNVAANPTDLYDDFSQISPEAYYPAASQAGVLSDNTWCWLAGNADVGHVANSRTNQQYLGDTAIVMTSAFSGNTQSGDAFTIAFGDGKTEISAYGGAIVDLTELFLWPGQLIDWSQVSNRRLLFGANGKPVNPAGAISTFGTPAVYLSGGAADFTTNQGSGGAFSLYKNYHTPALGGTLSDAPTSPSD